jgi:hypothetical protein
VTNFVTVASLRQSHDKKRGTKKEHVPFGSMPYEPVTLGFKFAIRLKQLTARDVLVVTCPACHKSYFVAPHILLERYHEHRPIESFASDFVCKRCGNRQDMSWRIDRAVGPEFSRSA